MKPEDKQLLLQDLCARLPYNVWISYKTKYDDIERATILNGNYVRDIMEGTSSWIDFKPYLRPLSSMTEEERKIQKGYIYHFSKNNLPDYEGDFVFEDEAHEYIDWLNKKMFDFRRLIPAGLAISTEVFDPYND